MMVRNTFIEMSVPSAPLGMRRCRSAPCSLEEVASRGGFEGCLASPRLVFHGFGVDEQASDMGWTGSDVGCAGSCMDEGAWLDDNESTAASSCLNSASHASPASRQSTSSRSAASSPTVAADEPPPSIMETFYSDVALVVEEITTALRHEQVCDHLEPRWDVTWTGASCCHLVAAISPERGQSSARLATAGKGAIMDIMGRGWSRGGVRLLGMRNRPFTDIPHGFTAVFGNPVSRRKTCRRLFDEGLCPFGRKCVYEHPSATVSLTVVAEPDGSEDSRGAPIPA